MSERWLSILEGVYLEDGGESQRIISLLFFFVVVCSAYLECSGFGVLLSSSSFFLVRFEHSDEGACRNICVI